MVNALRNSRIQNPNLLLLGIRWDGSSSYRKGARDGPKAIREATSSELYNSYTENLVNLAERWRYRDLGDVEGKSFAEVLERVRKLVGRTTVVRGFSSSAATTP